MKEKFGGYQNVGCRKRDLQNYSRDLKILIKDSDAQIFIDNFRRKQEVNPSFYYADEVDEEGRLKHAFWCCLNFWNLSLLCFDLATFVLFILLGISYAI
jgi:hypothetical protein